MSQTDSRCAVLTLCTAKSCCKAGAMNVLEKLEKHLPKCRDGRAVRLETANCLGECGKGARLMVQPAGVLYRRVKSSDVKELIAAHLVEGRTVKRLKPRRFKFTGKRARKTARALIYAA